MYSFYFWKKVLPKLIASLWKSTVVMRKLEKSLCKISRLEKNFSMVCQGLSEKTVAKYQLQYEVKNWYKEYIVASGQLFSSVAFLPYLSMLILSPPLLGLGCKSTSLSPEFCAYAKAARYDVLRAESQFCVIWFSLVHCLEGWNQ